MNPLTLPELVHRRWTLPALAHFLEVGGGTRFVQLIGHTGMSKDAASTTLKHLEALGLIARRSAFAHPLTPEYQLTTRGQRVAPAAAALWSPIVEDNLTKVVLKKWSLPILDAVPRSFGELKGHLAPITARALSLSIKELRARELIDEGYRVGSGAHDLVAPLRALSASLTI